MASLAAAVEEASAHPSAAAGPLRVAAPPGFASAWLCPRIGAFREAQAETALTLAVGPDERADVEILFTPPAEAEGAEPIAELEFFPVCAPALAHAAGGLRRPGALGGQVFLHLFDRRDWRAWSTQAAAPDLVDVATAEGRETIFDDANLLLAATVAGQGVALGDRITCARYLEEGALIRPLAATSPSARAYFLRIRHRTGAALAFSDWVKRELGHGLAI